MPAIFEVCGFIPLGAAVPPAADAIASGVMPAEGDSGYVVVGPTPASASGDGSRLKPNMLNFGILGIGGKPDLQPVIKTVTATIHIAFLPAVPKREAPRK